MAAQSATQPFLLFDFFKYMDTEDEHLPEGAEMLLLVLITSSIFVSCSTLYLQKVEKKNALQFPHKDPPMTSY